MGKGITMERPEGRTGYHFTEKMLLEIAGISQMPLRLHAWAAMPAAGSRGSDGAGFISRLLSPRELGSCAMKVSSTHPTLHKWPIETMQYFSYSSEC